MTAHKFIQVPDGVELAVMGDVHEHSEQFFKIVSEARVGQNRWLVSVGDIYDKGFGPKAAEKITDEMMKLQEKGVCYAVRGNHELKQCKKNRDKSNKYLKWWSQQPLAITFRFDNGYEVLVLHAGVSPNLKKEDIGRSVDICYTREVDENGKMIPLKWVYDPKTNEKYLTKAKQGTFWHELYDGRLGYIFAGHSQQENGKPTFYKYSCNLDTAVFDTGILTCQVVKSNGALGETIQVSGVARKPKLNVIK